MSAALRQISESADHAARVAADAVALAAATKATVSRSQQAVRELARMFTELRPSLARSAY